MKTEFTNAAGACLVPRMIAVIQANAQYLSDLDGLIGDGDHGINMAKGFTLAGEQLPEGADLATSLQTLGNILLNEIGGAMGPLYGSLFRAMARAARGRDTIDAACFSAMLQGALAKVRELGNAEVGDKTLLDVLAPAAEAFDGALADGKDFAVALDAMHAAAEAGRDSTKDLIAKKGRASRLGERSRGVLDAGATSCCLLLCTMAEGMKELL